MPGVAELAIKLEHVRAARRCILHNGRARLFYIVRPAGVDSGQVLMTDGRLLEMAHFLVYITRVVSRLRAVV